MNTILIIWYGNDDEYEIDVHIDRNNCSYTIM